MRKDIIVYLNSYEISSLQIQEKCKTPATYEMELFVTLANGCTPLTHGTSGSSKISQRS